MNFDILRQRILEKAIQGKLVPQLESEPEVNQVGEPPENVSFSIPEKWKWIHFSEAIETVSTKLFQIKSKEVLDKGLYPVVSQSKEILDGYSDNKNKLIPESKLPIILFGDHTRVLKYIDYRFIVGADGTKLLRVKNPALYPKYVYMALKWLINLTRERGYSRHFQFIKCVYLPCPPLEEQQRIIEKTKQLFDQINQAEKAYNELSGPLSERFRQLCLEKAIQGKLVPQLESEPPVEQIGKLIDKIPFPIPCKWKWIQLKHATTKITDGTHHSPPSFNKGDSLYITAKNIKSSGVDLANVTYVSKNIHEEIFKRCNPEPGDVLFIKDGATTGVVTINNLENPFSLLSSVALLKVKREILLPEFLIHVLRSQYTRDLVARQMQGTGIPRVTLKKLKEFWIPIPPLNEQYRISIKLQNLIATIPCEN